MKGDRMEQDIKKLNAEIGNLQVQVSEYQQIVQELSEKLKRYENTYGKVFTAKDSIKFWL
tara:strand:- start:530 stop:709 length:180 start_codon:yes stop_codon:yes gene_type:complete